MIVEFIGCTGSGKTRLIHQVQYWLRPAAQVISTYELVAGRIGLGGVRNPTAQNLIQEAAVLPYCVRAAPRYRAFLTFMLHALRSRSTLSLATLANLRSLERKIGTYEMARCLDRDAIVLLDEGPAQALHMFAFAEDLPTAAALARFAAALPLPDLLVYVRAPVATLLARTWRRADPPRELRAMADARQEGYIRHAAALFDMLAQSEQLRNRLLIIENPDGTQREYDRLVGGVATSILQRRAAGPRPGPAKTLSLAS